MQQLLIEITDLEGNRRDDGLVEQHTGAEVVVPLNDLRTARYDTSIWLPQVADLRRPLTRLCRVFTDGYDNDPAFVGLNIQPGYDFGSDTVTAAWVCGAALRLQLAVLHTPLEVNARDVGMAMWDLIARAANRDYPIGAPPLGITQGTIEDTFDITRRWEAGQHIYDAIVELAALEGAPDFRFVPLLRDDYVHWEFEALAPQGTDKTDTVVFHYGWGVDNAAGFLLEPDGAAVLTQYTSQGEAPDDGSLVQPKYTAEHPAAQLEIGLYEDWEANDATSELVQEAKAKQMVAAYHEAPSYYTVTPAYERAPGAPLTGWGTPPRFRADYDVGDITRTIAKKGAMVEDLAGRLRTATIRQVEQTGGWRVDLVHAPNVDGSGVV